MKMTNCKSEGKGIMGVRCTLLSYRRAALNKTEAHELLQGSVKKLVENLGLLICADMSAT
jgi:hypothetical protein